MTAKFLLNSVLHVTFGVLQSRQNFPTAFDLNDCWFAAYFCRFGYQYLSFAVPALNSMHFERFKGVGG